MSAPRRVELDERVLVGVGDQLFEILRNRHLKIALLLGHILKQVDV